MQLGYELHVPWGKCGQVLASLEREKGGELNCAGMEVADIQFIRMFLFLQAMENMAMEKGYQHWPADIQVFSHPNN